MDKNPLYEPKRLISLWDMIETNLVKLLNTVDMLELWKILLQKEQTPDRELTDGGKNNIKDVLSNVDDLCQLLEFTNTVRHLTYELRMTFCSAAKYGETALHLETLVKVIKNEAHEKKFVFIPTANHKFFEQESLFGKLVNDKFPDAAYDIKHAGTCVAIGLPDAAIFHLCRAAEWGLRALAEKWNVKFKAPLELQDWGTIIEAIDKKLALVKQSAKSPKKKRELELYTNLSSDCRAIKETWRDCIMHARGSFLDGDADATRERVKSFLQRLSEKM